MQYDFPADLKPAPARRRETFYREEFPEAEVTERMERWFQFVPVIDIGSDSTLYKPRFKKFKGKLVRITDYENVQELQQKLAEYAPEDIYYNRTIEKEDEIRVDPDRELVFGLRPEQLSCDKCDRKREYMDRKWYKYVFCMGCFEELAYETRNLAVFLDKHFDNIDIVYEGRGFNIHINDETAYKMDLEDRKELANKVATQFPVNPNLTAGDTDLIRLPGSLNGVVGKKVITLQLPDLHDPEAILEQATPASF